MRKTLIAALCLVCSLVWEARADPPNIVLMLADDLGWSDLGCYGSELHLTPHLDALAARGVLFTDGYANAPNCAPSRASLMTGLYTPRHGIYTVNSSARGKAANRKIIPTPNTTELDPEFETIAEMLREAGYATAHIGKWHLDDDPTQHGFDLNVGGFHKGHPKSYTSPYSNPALTDGPEGEYLTDRLTDEAVAFIEAERDTPFFLYLPYYTVHTPIQGRADLVATQRERATNDERIKPGFAAMVSAMDGSVGRVLDALEAQGLTDETIVVFMSDNGGHGNWSEEGPLRGSKGMMYEGGIRVPLIVAGPGVRPGVRETEPVIGIDLVPTLLDAAGVEEQPEFDGRSLWSVLAHADTPRPHTPDRPLFWHFPAYLEAYARGSGPWRTTPAGAVRLGNYKLIEWFEDGAVELYDLAADPGETHDLAPERPEVRDRLLEALRSWRERVDAPVPSEANPKYTSE